MNLRDTSKRNFNSTEGNTFAAINAGSLQRIADATELMAKRYQELIDEKECAERSRNFWCDKAIRRERQIAALRGVITKLRKKGAK